jgi:hypothetical protein
MEPFHADQRNGLHVSDDAVILNGFEGHPAVSSETLLHLDSLMKCNCVDQFAREVVACGRLPPGCQSRTPPSCAFSFVPRNVWGGRVVSRLAFPPPSTT